MFKVRKFSRLSDYGIVSFPSSKSYVAAYFISKWPFLSKRCSALFFWIYHITPSRTACHSVTLVPRALPSALRASGASLCPAYTVPSHLALLDGQLAKGAHEPICFFYLSNRDTNEHHTCCQQSDFFLFEKPLRMACLSHSLLCVISHAPTILNFILRPD
jgi:hypothetical protein